MGAHNRAGYQVVGQRGTLLSPSVPLHSSSVQPTVSLATWVYLHCLLTAAVSLLNPHVAVIVIGYGAVQLFFERSVVVQRLWGTAEVGQGYGIPEYMPGAACPVIPPAALASFRVRREVLPRLNGSGLALSGEGV